MTERKKSSVYLDPALIKALKVRAAREEKAEYQVIEDALRRHLGSDVIRRIQAKAALPEKQADAIAVEVARATRRASRKRTRA